MTSSTRLVRRIASGAAFRKSHRPRIIPFRASSAGSNAGALPAVLIYLPVLLLVVRSKNNPLQKALR